MPQVKVIAIQASEDLLQKLSALLGADLSGGVVSLDPSALDTVLDQTVAVEEEPVVPFGTETVNDENHHRFKRVFAVPAAAGLDVRATAQGVLVQGESVNGESLNTTIAPQGAFDEVTAVFDPDAETLTVRLFKITEEGREIEIVGFDGGFNDEPADDVDPWCDACGEYHS